MTHTMPEGTSEPQDFRLLDNGAALDGTGLTVALTMTHRDGTTVGSPAPTAAWLDQAAGTVRVTGTGGLPIAEYRVRYRLTDGAGTIGYYPNGDEADVWFVVRRLP